MVGFDILICLNLSKEFRFLYRFGTVFHIILPLKHSAFVPYREVLQNSQENTCASLQLYKKEALAQVFSCASVRTTLNDCFWFYGCTEVATSGMKWVNYRR